MFTAALLTIAKTRKQSKCPSTDERIKKMGCIYAVEYYSAIKKSEIMPFAVYMDGPRNDHTKWSKSEREAYGSTYKATKKCVSHIVVSDSFRSHGLHPAWPLRPWDSPGKDTGVGCHFPLQGIFPTQGSNLGLLHCRQILYQLNH